MDPIFRGIFRGLLLIIVATRVAGYSTADRMKNSRLVGVDITMTVPDILLYGSILGGIVYCIDPSMPLFVLLPLPHSLRWGGVIAEALGIVILLWTHLTLGKNYHPGL